MIELRSCGTFQYKQMKIEHNKPDLILLVDSSIVDFACPFDPRIEKKEKDQIKNYTDLKYEISKI